MSDSKISCVKRSAWLLKYSFLVLREQYTRAPTSLPGKQIQINTRGAQFGFGLSLSLSPLISLLIFISLHLLFFSSFIFSSLSLFSSLCLSPCDIVLCWCCVVCVHAVCGVVWCGGINHTNQSTN